MDHAWNIITDLLSLLFVLACFGYAGYRTLKESEDPTRLVVKWLITIGVAIVGFFITRHFPIAYWPPVAAAFAVPVGLMWAPNIGAIVANPITGMFDGGRAEAEKKPMYSYAEAKRRKGQPREAIQEVLKELAKFPSDITGVLMLAALHADDLKNLAAAEGVIEEYIAQPKLPPQAVSAALQNLADLQWRFGKGAAAATATLERITVLYPETPYAHAALQRIAHLDAADQTRQQRKATRYSVPTGERNLGLRTGVQPAFQAPEPPDEIARLVAQLEKHPADVDSREKLAVLYAEELGRVDLAVEQLEQLISLRAESPRRIAKWLNLLATVQARFGNDVAAAEAALHRIQEKFPKSAMAATATTRLASLQLEVKSHTTAQAKTLGHYEKHLGLKNT